MERTWRERIDGEICPYCRATKTFTRHGVYEKYLFLRRLSILRVRCRGCRSTHGVIPAFSLPGTSLGTSEVEAFIASRRDGQSRHEAGRHLTTRGVPADSLRRIEKLIHTAIHRAKALFDDLVSQIGEAYRWLQETTAGDPRPIVLLNRRSTALGYGAVFCSLPRGTGRRRHISGIRFSHDNTSAGIGAPLIHSG